MYQWQPPPTSGMPSRELMNSELRLAWRVEPGPALAMRTIWAASSAMASGSGVGINCLYSITVKQFLIQNIKQRITCLPLRSRHTSSPAQQLSATASTTTSITTTLARMFARAGGCGGFIEHRDQSESREKFVLLSSMHWISSECKKGHNSKPQDIACRALLAYLATVGHIER